MSRAAATAASVLMEQGFEPTSEHLSCETGLIAINSRTVGEPSMIRSPSSTLGLDADFVIHRGLNSLFATKISFSGLH